MSTHTNVQIINGIDGNPAFVVIPYADYLKGHTAESATIPNEVVDAVIKRDITPMQAWREYLQHSIKDIAAELNLSEAEYLAIENQAEPSKSVVKKVASLLAIRAEQLNV